MVVVITLKHHSETQLTCTDTVDSSGTREMRTLGIFFSFHPSCLSVLLPFLPLQVLHAVTRLDHSHKPPFDTGVMWSTVRSVVEPQYLCKAEASHVNQHAVLRCVRKFMLR